MNKLFEKIFWFGIFIGCVAGFVEAINAYMDLPTVYVSYSTGKCVFVESGNKLLTCKNMPEKYEHVWVK